MPADLLAALLLHARNVDRGEFGVYSYVKADPVNFTDPTGLEEEIVITGKRPKKKNEGVNTGIIVTGGAAPLGAGSGGVLTSGGDQEIVVTGTRPKKLPYDPHVMDYDIVLTYHGAPPRAQKEKPQVRNSDVCGSPGNSQYVPEGIAATSFQGPCLKHDNCYSTLGKTQEQCDQGLGRDILDECKRTGGSFCALASYIYYKTLSVTGIGLGTPAFQNAQRQARAALRFRR